MATVLNVLTNALQIADITPKGQAADADDTSFALRSLNRMLLGWKLVGVDLNWISLSSTSATMPVDDMYLDGIEYNLAVRLAAELDLSISEDVKGIAASYFRTFQAHTLEIPDDLQLDRALDPRRFAAIGGYDIDTDDG